MVVVHRVGESGERCSRLGNDCSRGRNETKVRDRINFKDGIASVILGNRDVLQDGPPGGGWFVRALMFDPIGSIHTTYHV